MLLTDRRYIAGVGRDYGVDIVVSMKRLPTDAESVM